jgi:predicted phage terminase large subunit-like protein
MHQMYDKSYVISDIKRGQWSALERELTIRATADADSAMYRNYEIGLEQEPGSGGKESAEATVRNLAGKRVFVDKVTGSKEARAEPFAAQVQGGNVHLVGADWYWDYVSEAETFPNGVYQDQIDASSFAHHLRHHLGRPVGRRRPGQGVALDIKASRPNWFAGRGQGRHPRHHAGLLQRHGALPTDAGGAGAD